MPRGRFASKLGPTLIFKRWQTLISHTQYTRECPCCIATIFVAVKCVLKVGVRVAYTLVPCRTVKTVDLKHLYQPGLTRFFTEGALSFAMKIVHHNKLETD